MTFERMEIAPAYAGGEQVWKARSRTAAWLIFQSYAAVFLFHRGYMSCCVMQWREAGFPGASVHRSWIWGEHTRILWPIVSLGRRVLKDESDSIGIAGPSHRDIGWRNRRLEPVRIRRRRRRREPQLLCKPCNLPAYLPHRLEILSGRSG